ncbi:hypothetical protein ACFCX0_09645 [Streptomyces sp. NPDC056352]|uniref:hypothetical protein n=1 Tax=Streptomyces sp. NPDC056352 TaxID=3345791 RepID=UPI0035DB389C
MSEAGVDGRSPSDMPGAGGEARPRRVGSGRVGRILDRARGYGGHVLIDARRDTFGPAFGHRAIPASATRTDGLAFTPHPDGWFSVHVAAAAPHASTRLYEDRGLQRAPADPWRVVAGKVQDRAATNGRSVQVATVRRVLDAPAAQGEGPAVLVGRPRNAMRLRAGSVSAAGARTPTPTRTK